MMMKRQTALALALAMVVTAVPVDAQLRGLIKKKAGEIVGAKKPEPAPAPAPAAPPPATTPATSAPAPATPPPAAAPAAAPTATTAAAPLEVSALPVRGSAVQVVRGRITVRESGDWNQLPAIPPAAVAAAYALGESAQVALVDTVGAALKALVMSAPFQSEHDAFIKAEHRGVDHGLKGVITLEDALKKNDLKAIEAIQARQSVAIIVDQMQAQPPDSLKMMFTQELADWKKTAANKTRRDAAKFQKMVAMAQPLEALAPGDEKFRRGYTVIKSIEHDGPDTEAAVYALHQRVTQENEQAAYDSHSLKGQLKRQLTTFVSVASKVNFKAPTVEKNKTTVFVNAADEKQGALWKACFRAGPAPTAAAIKLARAWLLEL
jgi:hypothetical protein